MYLFPKSRWENFSPSYGSGSPLSRPLYLTLMVRVEPSRPKPCQLWVEGVSAEEGGRASWHWRGNQPSHLWEPLCAAEDTPSQACSSLVSQGVLACFWDTLTLDSVGRMSSGAVNTLQMKISNTHKRRKDGMRNPLLWTHHPASIMIHVLPSCFIFIPPTFFFFWPGVFSVKIQMYHFTHTLGCNSSS